MSDTEDNWLKETGVILSEYLHLLNTVYSIYFPAFLPSFSEWKMQNSTLTRPLRTHGHKVCTEMNCSKKLHNLESVSVLITWPYVTCFCGLPCLRLPSLLFAVLPVNHHQVPPPPATVLHVLPSPIQTICVIHQLTIQNPPPLYKTLDCLSWKPV